MTYYFGKSSLAKLGTVDESLQEVMTIALATSPIDFGIISGLRTAEEQNKLFLKGASQRDGYDKRISIKTGWQLILLAMKMVRSLGRINTTIQ